ncbi:general odorant-binding protein 56a-like [Bacillus rossius redtenbacheri]|uniref:general odorant-binding protein 56a-like n=1 Tax=Bacillus rossius redtenbacheri TaxID=93214 RepID=UPI002FDD0A57
MLATHSIAVCYVTIVAFVSAAPKGMLNDTVFKTCAETYKLPAMTFDSRHPMEPIPDNPGEDIMCFHECLLTGEGTLKNGVFQEDVTKERFTMVMTAKMGSVNQEALDKVLACGKKTAEGKCATSYAIFKCIDDVLISVFKGSPH